MRFLQKRPDMICICNGYWSERINSSCTGRNSSSVWCAWLYNCCDLQLHNLLLCFTCSLRWCSNGGRLCTMATFWLSMMISKQAVAYRGVPPSSSTRPWSLPRGCLLPSQPSLEAFQLRFLTRLGGGVLSQLCHLLKLWRGYLKAYIATNVISITDGQIFTQRQPFQCWCSSSDWYGFFCITGWGSAQIKAMKVAGTLRMRNTASYRELEMTFTKFGSDLDATTQAKQAVVVRQPKYWKHASS